MKLENLFLITPIVASFLLCTFSSLYAQNGSILLNDGSTYMQDFNSMASTTLPTGFAIETSGNNSGGTNPSFSNILSQDISGNGSVSGGTAGGTYRLENTDNNNVYIGILGNGTASKYKPPRSIKATIKNNTASVITSITLSYRALQFVQQERDMAWLVYASNLNTTPLDSINFSGSSTTAWGWPFADSGLRSVTIPITLNPNDSFDIYWQYVETGGSGARSGLAIDDISITPVFASNCTVYSTQLPISSSNTDYIIANNTTQNVANNNCELLSTITTINSNLGNVDVVSTVSSPQQVGSTTDYYIGRSYQFNVDNQPIDNVTVSLFFTTQDIYDYNVVALTENKIIANESTNTLSNFYISHFNDGDIPGSGLEDVITPNSVSFNGNYWTVTFTTNHFSTFYAHGGNHPLPLDIQLNATNKNDVNIISWKLQEQSSGAKLILQRSEDGIHFSSIATLTNSSNKSDNTFVDEHPNQGWNYYRCQLLTSDTKTIYSYIVKTFAGSSSDRNIELYPNPVANELNITVPNFNNASIQITDITGKTVSNLKITTLKTVLDLSSLNNGLYFVKYSNNNQVSIHKIIVNK